MATYPDYINQAQKNLNFLCQVNSTIPESWDWQVTVSFYTALHLINAHIVQVTGTHYRSHEQVGIAINPYHISPAKLPEDVYLGYVKLQALSRRARYLYNEKNKDDRAHFTYDKHLSRAVRHLDCILKYFQTRYNVAFKKSCINCRELKSEGLYFFEEVSR